MSDENDPLVRHLVELCKELDGDAIPILLGGGMGLYLRLRFIAPRTSRYPFDLPVRSTADLDVFLSSSLIVDRPKIEALRAALGRLGYEVAPEAKNFQFAKTVRVLGQDRRIKVDLLSAPPEKGDAGKVEVKRPRIKPAGAKGIHAYLTEEAAGIEIGKQPVEMARLDPEARLQNRILFLPSSFNFLILKLNAFGDRKNDADSDYGRHHAADLFAAVARMGETDWAVAKEHLAAHGEREYLKKTQAIRRENFSKATDLGLLRLRESETYRRNREVFNTRLEQFIADLQDLFPG